MTTAAAETSLSHAYHDAEHSTTKNCHDDAGTDADQYSDVDVDDHNFSIEFTLPIGFILFHHFDIDDSVVGKPL